MFDPRLVVSPRDKWHLIRVLLITGGPDNNWWSIALGTWKNEEGEKPALGIRWNGDEDTKGNPTSRGYPTWFILPEEFHDFVLNSLLTSEDRDFAIRVLR